MPLGQFPTVSPSPISKVTPVSPPQPTTQPVVQSSPELTAQTTTSTTPLAAANPTVTTTSSKPPAKPSAKPTTMSKDQLKNIWIQAGGNPQAAAMAAAVADASSGGNPNATFTNPDGSVGVGLWLIDKNGMPPGSTDPLANARAAVQLSNNGTNWKNWCVAWSDNACGQNNGTYLGDGSNALGSLGGDFTLAGATPTGDGTSASTASSTIPSTPKAGGSKVLMIAALVLIAGGIWYFMRRQRGNTPTEAITPDGS